VERKLESKIRRRFDQLYDDLVEAEYDAQDVQDLLDGLEDDLIEELDSWEDEDDE
jgi:hypothetical protein